MEAAECPSSDDLRPIRHFENGGSGSSKDWENLNRKALAFLRLTSIELMSVHDGGAIKARGRKRQAERFGHIGGAHGGTKLPGHDVT